MRQHFVSAAVTLFDRLAALRDQAHSSAAQGQSQAARLTLEQMEDRWVPSILTAPSVPESQSTSDPVAVITDTPPVGGDATPPPPVIGTDPAGTDPNSLLKSGDGTVFMGMFDVPGVLNAEAGSVALSTAANTNITLVANPTISAGELYRLEIAVGDGQFTFAPVNGVQLYASPTPTPGPAVGAPSTVVLTGTISALNAALATGVYTAATVPVAETDTISLRLSGLGERVDATTGASLQVVDHIWAAAVAVKRDKPTGPAPTPGQTQTLQGSGDFAIPRNSFVGVTDKTVRGDSSWLWIAKPSSATQESGITSWDDLITKMEASKPEGGYSALVISGHGSGTGGVQASGGSLDGANLTQAQADKLKALLKDGAPVVLFACCQGNNAGCQTLADKLGHPVIGNKDSVNQGNSGDGDWVRFNPK